MDGSRPTNTVKWLNMRSWCTSHHHIRCPESVFKTSSNEKLVKKFFLKLFHLNNNLL
jgi:lysophospholipid hydrolase